MSRDFLELLCNWLNLQLTIKESWSEMRDLFEKIKTNRGPIGQHAKESHGYFTFPKLEGAISPRMVFRGKERLNWSLNNYLGLANHPEVRAVDAQAAS